MAIARPFISYAREDYEVAVRLRSELIAMGAKPWMDRFDLVGGQTWETAIRDAVRRATHCIILISRKSVTKRGYFQTEMRHALKVVEELPPNRLFVIPVRLENAEPLHEHLRSIHWIDLFDDYREGLKRLAASLGIRFDKFEGHDDRTGRKTLARKKPQEKVETINIGPALSYPDMFMHEVRAHVDDPKLVKDIWGKWRIKQFDPAVECIRCRHTLRAAEAVVPLEGGEYAHYLDCLDNG